MIKIIIKEMNMNTFLLAFIFTLIAGLATVFGAFIVFITNQHNYRILAAGLGFSAGAMIYISFVEILPQAISGFEKMFPSYGEILGICGFFIGVILSAFLDRLVPQEYNPHEPHEKANSSSLQRIGLMSAIAIGVHNFPEGFATFVSTFESPTFGLMIAIAIAIHNIPEGMAVALPVYHSSGSYKKAILYSALSGIAEPLGAMVGALIIFPLFGDISVSVAFALIAGVMVFISLDELLPSAREYGKSHDSLYGLFLGMAVMAVSLVMLKM